jgi:hypothetical protein
MVIIPDSVAPLAGLLTVKVFEVMLDCAGAVVVVLAATFWTLRLKVTVADVPPDCPAATEKATTLIEFVPFAS